MSTADILYYTGDKVRMKKLRKVKEAKAQGRPTLYKDEFEDQVFKLCLLGATDAQIANFFGIRESTLGNWKLKHVGFLEALKRGKDEADAVIAHSLFQRAKGYQHDDVHIGIHQGQAIVTPIIKHYPPDTTACIFWLKNRQKENWRDRHEFTGDDGGPIKVSGITIEIVKPKDQGD